MRSKVSVVLCTYNGERYLREQLDSYLRQTRLPDELVVGDDRSTDATMEILGEFARDAPFPVSLHVNERTLRSARNFEAAARRASGDVVVFSDQDDVWLPQKVECLEEAILAHPQNLLAFTDATVVDARLEPLGYTFWEGIGFTDDEQARLADAPHDVMWNRNVVMGAASAVRARLVEKAFPLEDAWGHDGWLAFLAAFAGRLVPVPEPTVLYRQHGANVVGGVRRTEEEAAAERRRWRGTSMRDTMASDAARWAAVLDAAPRVGILPERAGVVERLRERVAHLRARAELPPNRPRRLLPVARELAAGRYGRHSSGILSAAKDLMMR